MRDFNIFIFGNLMREISENLEICEDHSHHLVARKMVRQMRRAETRARRQGTMIGARASWTGWGGGEGRRVWQVYVYNLVCWCLQLIFTNIS